MHIRSLVLTDLDSSALRSPEPLPFNTYLQYVPFNLLLFTYNCSVIAHRAVSSKMLNINIFKNESFFICTKYDMAVVLFSLRLETFSIVQPLPSIGTTLDYVRTPFNYLRTELSYRVPTLVCAVVWLSPNRSYSISIDLPYP